MPVLKNARYEQFSQGLAKGLPATEAYVQAGYNESRSAASRLSTNVNIQRRIAEIKARVAEKAEWSAADRLISLKSIHDASLTEDRRTAIAAIAEANKMQGSYAPTKQELTGKGGGPIQTVELTNVSDEHLAALKEIFGPLASGAGGDDESDPSGGGET